MELLKQFQGFIGSILFGFFFYMLFHAVYRCLQKTSFLIKFPAFLITFLGGTFLYFIFLVKYNYGIMNIFYPLSILIGTCLYHLFYFIPFDSYYLYKIEKVKKLFKLKTKLVFDIISKKMKEKKNVKITKSKKQID